MSYECVFCIIRSFEKLLKIHPIKEELKDDIVADFLSYMSSVDFKQPTPEIAREIHSMIKDYLNNPDPYKSEKKANNEFLLKLYPELKEKVTQSENPFKTALRLSIAGNIVDYAACQEFDIIETINHVLTSEFGINHSELLKQEIEKAQTILYLGDNAGEIVLDKLFLETLNHPNVYFAVKDKPIINDATIEDANFVGINNIAKIISNGYDAPSTIIEKASGEFLDIYNKADLIISKGQGNFEGLINNNHKNLFFLLMVKCDVIGRLIGVNKGDFVVIKN